MPPRALFFDMDDTLLNTSGGVQESWRVVCEEFGAAAGVEPVTLREAIRRESIEFWKDEAAVEARWRTRLAEAREHVITLALAAEGGDPAVAPRLGARYWDEVSSRMELFEDARHTLEHLRESGYRLGLITNGPAEMQLWKVRQFDLERHFDVIVIEGVFGRGKPHPDVFHHALEQTGATAGEAWHIGDNHYADIGGAQRVGIHAVWIHRGRLEQPAEPAAAPDRVIGHLDELVAALAEE